jgi:enediyne biosynthesis protein E4
VQVEAGGQKQWAERGAGSGYLSQDDGRLHFGLGPNAKADRITVTWPSGVVQVVKNVAANQVITVAEK